jgi:hypothetical protein
MTSAAVRRRKKGAPRRGSALTARVLAACVGAMAAGSGCASNESLGLSALSIVGAGVVNDPANKSLRFDLLKFGLQRFCSEMRKRGAPLKMNDSQPVTGRFFADSCQTLIIDEEQRQSIVLRYGGRGYGWTNLTQRIGFQSSGVIEYAVDFQTHDEAMYIYFRPRSVGTATFQTLLVESALAQVGMGLTGVNPDQIGRDIMVGQLQRGFTVLRYSARGDTELGMGIVPVGQRPFHPFTVSSSERLTVDNDRTEVHAQQQDFIGGLLVPEGGGKVTLNMSVDGSPALDVFVLPEVTALGMLQGYVTQAGAARLAGPAAFEAVLVQGQPQRWQLTLPAGLYYLLLDQSALAGRAAPPDPSYGDRAAKVDYLIQLE